MKIEGKDVVVPQGKRINMPQYTGSSFDKVRSDSTPPHRTAIHHPQSEYLLYKESQVRLRYIMKLQWP